MEPSSAEPALGGYVKCCAAGEEAQCTWVPCDAIDHGASCCSSHGAGSEADGWCPETCAFDGETGRCDCG